MCLGIPGQLLDVPEGGSPYVWVDVSGARRRVNVALLAEDQLKTGDWVLIHVGFALAVLDEPEARATIAMLEGMEAAYRDELRVMAASVGAPHDEEASS